MKYYYKTNYLMHFNKNHSPKDGKFTSGDGDGDGITNDHAHRSKKSRTDGWYDYNKDVIRKVDGKYYYIDKDGNKHQVKLSDRHALGNWKLKSKYGSRRVDSISLLAKNKEEDVKGHKIIGRVRLASAGLNIMALRKSKSFVGKAITSYYLVKNLTTAARYYATAKLIDKEIADMPVSELFKNDPDFDG
jgi:hypothetical protein